MNSKQYESLTDEEREQEIRDILYMLGVQEPEGDHLNDLNAMCEAEKCASSNDKYFWQKWMPHFVNKLGRRVIYRDLLEATASQRAEAFVLTMTKNENVETEDLTTH